MLTLIDGRPDLIEEARSAPPRLRTYIQDEFAELRDEPYFSYAVEGALGAYGPLAPERARIVAKRLDDLLA